jgi:plastocyanin
MRDGMRGWSWLGAWIVASGIAAGQDAASGIAVRGEVRYEGRVPEAVPNPEGGAPRPIVAIGADGGLADVVVWLDGVTPPPGAPGGEVDAPAVLMDQKDFLFVPHVVAVEAGGRVEFRNSDVANHGVRGASVEDRNSFNVTTPPGGSYTHRFAASRFPVSIGCPIHAAMAGWVFVFDHPYFAVTDESGRFAIEGVPPGRYRLEARHPSGGMRAAREIRVEAGSAGAHRIDFTDADLRRGL